MRFFVTVAAALLATACASEPQAPQANTASSKGRERVCATGSNICSRSTPSNVETLTKEDIRNMDGLPAQKPLQ